MNIFRFFAASAVLAAAVSAGAQQVSQPELKIDSANRTLALNATGTVSVEPDEAILHIGFQTMPASAKAAYAEGAQTSNAIINAIEQAGVPKAAIHSESQYLAPDYTQPKSHKFRLVQQWTVKTTPAHAAEILDDAVTAGANTSGQIDWTVKDERPLEDQALDKAAARVQEDAAALAKAMGVRIVALIYVSNQASAPIFPRPMMLNSLAMAKSAEPAPPLSIEPQKVIRSASVYAVYAIQ